MARPGPRLAYPRHDPLVKREIASRRAAGETITTIAKSLDLSGPTVSQITKLPDVVTMTASLREKYRLRALERMGGMMEPVWDLTAETVAKKDPQGFMRMTAGISNLAKVADSGEKHQVEVSGVPGEQSPKVEIKLLIQQLFGDQLTPRN